MLRINRPTIVIDETLNLREIANNYVGHDGIIVRQTSARFQNLCKEAIRVTIEIRIFIEKSIRKKSINHICSVDRNVVVSPQFSFIFEETIPLGLWQFTHRLSTNGFRSIKFHDRFTSDLQHFFDGCMRCIMT